MHDPPRILIVDDNETNRCILVARLGAEGYETGRRKTAKGRSQLHVKLRQMLSCSTS